MNSVIGPHNDIICEFPSHSGVVGCSAVSGEGLKEGLEWLVKCRNTAKTRKYMEGPVKETLEDGKAVLKSGHSWLSSFFSRQSVKT